MKVAIVRVGGCDALRGHAEIQGDLRWNVSGHAFSLSDGSHQRHGQEQEQS